jgi:parvulin-like peptidyl-prolyl isomerase
VTTLAQRLAVVLVALMAAGCSLTGTGDPSTAATVGDRAIPASDVDEMLASIQNSSAFQQQAQGDTSGQFVLDAQTQLVTQFVRSEILAVLADEQGLDVSDEEVAAARADLAEQAGGEEALQSAIAEQGFTEDFLVQQLRDQQIQALLQDEIGVSTNLAEYIQAEIADVPIEVNPRYGQWDPEALAVAPFDPLAIAGGEEPAGSETPTEAP